MMNTQKKYPHLQDEENRLSNICYEQLAIEYGDSVERYIKDRMENELAAISKAEMSGVVLILHELIRQSGLKKYQIAFNGTLGASYVAWLCGLTPFNPLKTELPLYPEFCFGIEWNKELYIELCFPVGYSEVLCEMIKGIEGVEDVVPLHTDTELVESEPLRWCIIPTGEEVSSEKSVINDSSYFELSITELRDLSFLTRLVGLTGFDPEGICLADREVLDLFKRTDIPDEIAISPFRLSSIGLLGMRDPYELLLFGNVNLEVESFSDLVRVDSLAHSTGVWYDNQEEWIQNQTISYSDLITCREDVFEYCQRTIGFPREEAYMAAEMVRKGKGFPYELRSNACEDSYDEYCLNWDYQTMPVWFHSFCTHTTHLWTRVLSYCHMVIAWRCAWYRLHYPVEFYQAYFEIISGKAIGNAVFDGKASYTALILNSHQKHILEDADYNSIDDLKLDQFDIDCAVADEMYFRGIDLTNIHHPSGASDLAIRVLDGQISVLSGRPGVGKTRLACDMVSAFSSFAEGMPVIISLEMGAEKISDLLSKRENCRCLVFDNTDESLSNVTSHLSELDVDVSIFILDYIQLLQVSDMKKTIAMLHRMAEDFSAPVLIISQLPRSIDERDDKYPKLSDLPMVDSLGLIDNVIFLYREDYYTEGNTGAAEAIIAKGAEGEEIIHLSWDAEQGLYNMV